MFAGEDRYAAIERFIAVLAPYIEKGMPSGRCGYHGGRKRFQFAGYFTRFARRYE